MKNIKNFVENPTLLKKTVHNGVGIDCETILSAKKH